MATLLDAPETIDWIKQFDPPDRDLARTLIKSLVLVSHNDFRAGLRERIEALAAASDPPLALYAVREVDGIAAYFSNKRNRPSPVQAGRKVGSEGEVSSLITQLERSKSDLYLNHPPLVSLKDRRCHNIALVDDLSASGDQVSKFINAFYAHRTIKSWCSYHWVTFHVVTFAITEQAEDKIVHALTVPHTRRSRADVTFHYCYRPTHGPSTWPRDLRAQMMALCKKYGRKSMAKWMYYLGYRNAMTTLVFAHGCPNNAPAILWNASKVWRPLFPGRAIPRSLLPFFSDPDATLNQTERLGLLVDIDSDQTYEPMSPTALQTMLVLAAIRRKLHQMDRISQATGLMVPQCEQVVENCKTWGFLDGSGHLTDLGLKHLQHVVRSGRLPDQPPPLSSDFYFPKSLRATRESV